jgi:hypothetical protein
MRIVLQDYADILVACCILSTSGSRFWR